jgi:hypothetical protein
MKINKTNKKYIISGAIFGIIFGSFMAGYDYLISQPFSIFKLLFNVFVMGTLIGYINYRAVIKVTKKRNS